MSTLTIDVTSDSAWMSDAEDMAELDLADHLAELASLHD